MEQSAVCILTITVLLRHCPHLLVRLTARLPLGNHYDGVLRIPDGASATRYWFHALNFPP